MNFFHFHHQLDCFQRLQRQSDLGKLSSSHRSLIENEANIVNKRAIFCRYCKKNHKIDDCWLLKAKNEKKSSHNDNETKRSNFSGMCMKISNENSSINSFLF